MKNLNRIDYRKRKYVYVYCKYFQVPNIALSPQSEKQEFAIARRQTS